MNVWGNDLDSPRTCARTTRSCKLASPMQWPSLCTRHTEQHKLPMYQLRRRIIGQPDKRNGTTDRQTTVALKTRANGIAEGLSKFILRREARLAATERTSMDPAGADPMGNKHPLQQAFLRAPAQALGHPHGPKAGLGIRTRGKSCIRGGVCLLHSLANGAASTAQTYNAPPQTATSATACSQQ
jgi:hypothetical protein